MIDQLRSIPISELNRLDVGYDSAAEFKALVELAHEEYEIRNGIIVQTVKNIYEDTLNDGHGYGIIPGLTGRALKVWNQLKKVTENREIREFLGEGYHLVGR